MFQAIKDNFNSEKETADQVVSEHFSEPIYNPFIIKNPQTQKARGILFLQNDASASIGVSDVNMLINKHIAFKSGTMFTESSFNYPVFARPCPTVPRHGFVDSIVCKNSNELNSVSLETNKVEPDAEILVTKPINSFYNAIVTGGVITFGDGNDGATSGKNVKYFYLNEDPIGPAINLDQSVLLEGEVPFYEIVMGENNVNHGATSPYLVQVRSAPGMPASKNFIPKEIKVEKIIKAEGDLIEWEKKVQNIDSSNTIIDHEGGSLASHFSIHAVVNNIAIFTENVPSIGDTVFPNSESSDITDEHRQKFKNAFFHAFSCAGNLLKAGSLKYLSSSVMSNIVKLGLSSIHNYAAINKHKDYELLGHVMGLFVKSIFSVSMGECRYAASKVNSIPKIYKDITNHGKSRSFCYKSMLENDVTKSIYDIHRAFFVFDSLEWNGSYGGEKWANCTRSAIDLYNSCVEGDIVSIVQKFNTVIHESHNGGPYLNKIIDIYDFDMAAKNPSLYAIQNLSNIVDILSFVNNQKGKVQFYEDDFSLIDMNLKPFHLIGGGSNNKPKGKNNSFAYTTNDIKIIEFNEITLSGNLISGIATIDFIDNFRVKLNITAKHKIPNNTCQHSHMKLVPVPHWYAYEGDKNIKIISKKSLNKIFTNCAKSIENIKYKMYHP